MATSTIVGAAYALDAVDERELLGVVGEVLVRQRPVLVADEPVLDLGRLVVLEEHGRGVVHLAIVGVNRALPDLFGGAIVGERSEQALEPFADEGVADVRAVRQVLHLVEVDGNGARDAPQDVRRRERYERLLVAAAVGDGVACHAGRIRIAVIGTKAPQLNPHSAHTGAFCPGITCACPHGSGSVVSRSFSWRWSC